MYEGFYQRLRKHALASDTDVIRAIWAKLAPWDKKPDKRETRKELYRRILKCHHEAAKTYVPYQF